MNHDLLLTRDVARQLRRAPYYLISLIRGGRMPAPPRDSSGRYVWRPGDVEAARRAMGTGRRRREHRGNRRRPAHVA
jgi:hypothetical protein